MKPVYMIILMEQSAEEFLNVYPAYIHRQHTVMDSGADIQFLQKAIYISLDTFHSMEHNINTELDAWLTFFSSDDPDTIVKLVNQYPQFRDMYLDIVEFRRDPRRLINMYSEALAIMDRNTVEYMCEKMKKEIDQQKEVLKEQQKEMNAHECMISEQKSTISEQKSTISQQESTISQQESTIIRQKKEIEEKDAIIAAMQAELERIQGK